ncbi:MAG TPA: hypothetical protein VH639_04720 [Bryobacteraceae bacterium]
MRIAGLLLSFALMASTAYPLDRNPAAVRAPKAKVLNPEDSRRLAHMQKRDRQMDKAMAKRAKAARAR